MGDLFIKEGLAAKIQRGCIFNDVKGNTPNEVLSELIGSLPLIPLLSFDTLLQAVLEREALMPTGIGRGIAIPHPRNILLPPEGEQYVFIAYTENPIDWNALDGIKADTLFLIISPSNKKHLEALTEINFLCRNEDFYLLLKERANMENLLAFIKEAEKQWRIS